MTALPFLPHVLDAHPDRDRIEATFAERSGTDTDPDLPGRLKELEDEVAGLEDDVDALDAQRRRMRDALSALVVAAETGSVPQDVIDAAKDALTGARG